MSVYRRRPHAIFSLGKPTIHMINQLKKDYKNKSRVIDAAVREMYEKRKR